VCLSIYPHTHTKISHAPTPLILSFIPLTLIPLTLIPYIPYVKDFIQSPSTIPHSAATSRIFLRKHAKTPHMSNQKKTLYVGMIPCFVLSSRNSIIFICMVLVVSWLRIVCAAHGVLYHNALQNNYTIYIFIKYTKQSTQMHISLRPEHKAQRAQHAAQHTTQYADLPHFTQHNTLQHNTHNTLQYATKHNTHCAQCPVSTSPQYYNQIRCAAYTHQAIANITPHNTVHASLRIYIRAAGGLDEQVTEAILKAAFIPFGDIVDVIVPLDHNSRITLVPINNLQFYFKLI
jgi:hypothetical protein